MKTTLRRCAPRSSSSLALFSSEVKVEPRPRRRLPSSHWNSLDNQRRFLDDLVDAKITSPLSSSIPSSGNNTNDNVRNMDDYYKLSYKLVLDNGGSALLSKHNGSIFQTLSSLYPEKPWDPLKFSQAPRNYWNNNIANQKKLLNDIEVRMGLRDASNGKESESFVDDWYKVSNRTFLSFGGGPILNLYKSSLYEILSNFYPNMEWDKLKFSRVPRNFFSSLDNQRAFLIELGKLFGIDSSKESGKEREEEMAKWYKITSRQIVSNGGGRLLAHYGNSISALLSAVFPDFQFDPAKFSRAPNNHWASIANQRAFMDDLAKRLGFADGENENDKGFWYKVSSQQVSDNGGKALLDLYNGSMALLVTSVYPEYTFSLWKFPRRSLHKIKSSSEAMLENQKLLSSLFEEVEKVLEIKNHQEWYRVNREQLRSLPIKGFFKAKNRYLLEALKVRYPDATWDEDKFLRAKSAGNKRSMMS